MLVSLLCSFCSVRRHVSVRSLFTASTMMVFSDQTSVWFPCDEMEAEPEAEARVEERAERSHRHAFLSKTVRTR